MNALLIVEHDFLVHHVGVRRVIFYYWQNLIDAGYTVTLAAPRDGELFISEPVELAALIEASRRPSGVDAPCWTTADPVLRSRPVRSEATSSLLAWRDRKVLLDDFDVTVITAPWICAQELPEWRYTAGVVYDLVPNLMACGALNTGVWLDIYDFARQHDVGNKFFLDHVDNICCISENTRQDFLNFYALEEDPRIQTVMPFRVNADARVKPRPVAKGERPRLLLVNVLDPRKNFKGVANALKIASAEIAFDVVVVGKERMPISMVFEMLEDMRAAGIAVEWYSEASDDCLDRLYGDADLLVFPSFYEGLGLPILEAQMHGVATVSSDSSSCAEVNMNAALCVDPSNHHDLARKIINALRDPAAYLDGMALRQKLEKKVNQSNNLPFISVNAC